MVPPAPLSLEDISTVPAPAANATSEKMNVPYYKPRSFQIAGIFCWILKQMRTYMSIPRGELLFAIAFWDPGALATLIF